MYGPKQREKLASTGTTHNNISRSVAVLTLLKRNKNLSTPFLIFVTHKMCVSCVSFCLFVFVCLCVCVFGGEVESLRAKVI